jgi:hypothetical protein
VIRLPSPVLAELVKTGLEWTTERGSKHFLIKSGRHILAIVGVPFHENDRALKNTIGTIRRNARKIKNGDFVKSRNRDL